MSFSASCLELTLAGIIGPKDVEVHESYPLPSCLQRLVINYLAGIVEVVVHAKHIYHHRLHMDASLPPDQDIDDLIVDAIYLNMDDPLSEPVSSLEDILCRFIPDLDEEEIWFKTRREQLQAYVSAAVHPEAAITCLKRLPEAVLTSELKLDAQTAEVSTPPHDLDLSSRVFADCVQVFGLD